MVRYARRDKEVDWGRIDCLPQKSTKVRFLLALAFGQERQKR